MLLEQQKMGNNAHLIHREKTERMSAQSSHHAEVACGWVGSPESASGLSVPLA